MRLRIVDAARGAAAEIGVFAGKEITTLTGFGILHGGKRGLKLCQCIIALLHPVPRFQHLMADYRPTFLPLPFAAVGRLMA